MWCNVVVTTRRPGSVRRLETKKRKLGKGTWFWIEGSQGRESVSSKRERRWLTATSYVYRIGFYYILVVTSRYCLVTRAVNLLCRLEIREGRLPDHPVTWQTLSPSNVFPGFQQGEEHSCGNVSVKRRDSSPFQKEVDNLDSNRHTERTDCLVIIYTTFFTVLFTST